MPPDADRKCVSRAVVLYKGRCEAGAVPGVMRSREGDGMQAVKP